MNPATYDNVSGQRPLDSRNTGKEHGTLMYDHVRAVLNSEPKNGPMRSYIFDNHGCDLTWYQLDNLVCPACKVDYGKFTVDECIAILKAWSKN